MKHRRAPFAAPSTGRAAVMARNGVIGRAYVGSGACRRAPGDVPSPISVIRSVRCSATKTSSIEKSSLPVAAMPSTCHTSCTSTASMGTSTHRMSGRSAPSMSTVPIAQSLWRTPLA